ncbi:family 43 glycosylhydrolase [Pricia sp.]|uniref:family 43 glycosylhydrolase n=1 Tax=Pricia sp. TaxID=2268138 RepID=UPI003594816F
MKQKLLLSIACITIGISGISQEKKPGDGNPIFEGWYADPEGVVFDDTYWVFPTFSNDYDKQLHFDAFSSKDLVNWEKHKRILDTTQIKWLRQALWAPSIIEKNDKYFLFFGANDIQRPGRDSYDPNEDRDHRVVCLDRMEFNDDGTVKPVKMTFKGISAE